MKLRLLIVLIMAGAITVTAKNTDKHIVSYSASDNMLVYIKPRKIPATNNGLKTKPLIYDITLNLQTDSIAFTYTLTSQSPTIQTDSISINKTQKFANEKIYAEPKSNNWLYRLRFTTSIAKFKEIFCSTDAITLIIDNHEFILSEHQQKKDAIINCKALQIIELNKQ